MIEERIKVEDLRARMEVDNHSATVSPADEVMSSCSKEHQC